MQLAEVCTGNTNVTVTMLTCSSASGCKHITQLCSPGIIQDKEQEVWVLVCTFAPCTTQKRSWNDYFFSFFLLYVSKGASGASCRQLTFQHFKYFISACGKIWGLRLMHISCLSPGHSLWKSESYLLAAERALRDAEGQTHVCPHQYTSKHRCWEDLFQCEVMRGVCMNIYVWFRIFA